MGLFSPGRRNELLSILKIEKQKYEELSSEYKERRKRIEKPQNKEHIKKIVKIIGVVEVIISFINYVIQLIVNYYRYDFKKSNKGRIFQKNSRKLDKHITSIIHRGRDCGLNDKKIWNFWQGRNIGNVDAAQLNEGHVRDFVNSVRNLLDYLYIKLKKV